MKATLQTDIIYFSLSFVMGISMGFVYDLLRAKRRLIKTNDIIINTEDAIFAILSAVFLLILAYAKNFGKLRFYSPVTALSAFAIYRLALKDLVVNILTEVAEIIFKFICKIFKVFCAPVSFIINASTKFLRKIFGILGPIVDRAHKLKVKIRS